MTDTPLEQWLQALGGHPGATASSSKAQRLPEIRAQQITATVKIRQASTDSASAPSVSKRACACSYAGKCMYSKVPYNE